LLMVSKDDISIKLGPKTKRNNTATIAKYKAIKKMKTLTFRPMSISWFTGSLKKTNPNITTHERATTALMRKLTKSFVFLFTTVYILIISKQKNVVQGKKLQCHRF